MTNVLPEQETAVSLLTYESAVEAVLTQMEDNLRFSPQVIRTYTTHLSLSQGKFIRAKCLLAAAMDSENQVHPDGIKLACALELLHLASLVHDDVIDDSDLRRGKQTLQDKFGKKAAVICGDWLLCQSLKLAAGIEKKQDFFSRTFMDFSGKLCLGELEQHQHNGDFNLGYYRYLAIISGKTAALFEGAFYSGGVVASLNQEEITSLSRIGKYLGMIFQLIDDCLDYEDERDRTGKPVKSDFEQGVITMPLIHALRSSPDLQKKIKKISPLEVVQAVKKEGGVFFTKKVAARYYQKALQILDNCSMTEEKRDTIIFILEKALAGAQKI